MWFKKNINIICKKVNIIGKKINRIAKSYFLLKKISLDFDYFESI